MTTPISEVTVTGGLNGKLYLQGKPTLSPDGRTLELSHFEFTMDTSNMLARFGNRMLYDAIREKILPNTRLDVGDRIARAPLADTTTHEPRIGSRYLD